MKTKKILYEISDTININPLDRTSLHFFKIFSLSIWLVIMSISLSLVTQSVRAGTEDIHRYYRYVPYEGPVSATGTAGERPKQSGGANATEAKKTEPSEQAKKATENTGTAATDLSAKESSTSKCAGAEKTTSGDSSSEGKPPCAENVGQESKQPSAAATESSGLAPASGSQAITTQQSPLAKDTKAESSTSGDQKSPVKKPEKDTGEFPSFAQVDINGDHYITKDELQNFPELLQVFDKVDAGKDGKLEQHEYQNLEMETKREGEIS
ncbi:MAG: hypothetical protein Q7U66_13350 [Methylobacter sp.]|nr:hypothetical protein [Methylobacter sp.]